MPIIDHSSIKRVSQDDGLESITLRSDLAARYIFLNETLFEGLGAIEIDQRFREMVGLKEIIKDRDGNLIVDEMKFLENWESQLQNDVNELEKSDGEFNTNSVDSSHNLDQLIKALDGPFKNEAEFENVCSQTETSLKEILKKD